MAANLTSEQGDGDLILPYCTVPGPRVLVL